MSSPARLSESKDALAPLLSRTRLLYTDLDGTLLGPGGSVFSSAEGTLTLEPAAALVEAIRAGIDIVPISGRNKFQLLDDVRMLALRDYIAEAGCLIVHDRMAEEWQCVGGFPVVDGLTVYETIVASGAAKLLFDTFPGRLEHHTPWSGHRQCSHIFRGNVNIGEVAFTLEAIDLPLTLIDNGIIRPRHHTLVGVDEVHAYHLLPRGASKPTALREDLRLRGVDAGDVVAIGDSSSDLELSEEVAAFFLVRNGLNDDAVLERAARDNVFVTDGEMGIGWAQAVRLICSTK